MSKALKPYFILAQENLPINSIYRPGIQRLQAKMPTITLNGEVVTYIKTADGMLVLDRKAAL